LFLAHFIFVGSQIVKAFVANKIGEKKGRKIDLGGVSTNIFTLSTTMRNRVNKKIKTLAIDKLYGDVSLARVSNFSPVINEIRVTQVVVCVIP